MNAAEHLRALHAMLFPERYPAGTPGHDPDHVFWQGEPEPGDAFEWKADTIEWVANYLENALEFGAVNAVSDSASTQEALAELQAQAPPTAPAEAVVGDDGVVRCSLCGTDSFKYEESHPSERSLKSNANGTLVFWSDFEWFEGDDDPGVVCSEGHHVDASNIETEYA